MLDPALREQLKGYLERLTRPVLLVGALDDSSASVEMRSLLTEIESLSEMVSYTEDETSSDRRPSFSVRSPGEEIRLAFAGMPMGHEFTSLVLALLQVGGHPSKAAPALIEQIARLPGPYQFETFYSQSCHNCPDVVQALNLMAVLNSGVSHVAIDGGMFPQEVQDRGIMGVPAVFLEGELFSSGRTTLEDIIAKLDTGLAHRTAKLLSDKAPFDVLIVGGGPAGAAAAIYAARKGIRTGLVAGRFGGQVLDTMAIENFVSVSHTEGPRFVAQLEEHVKNYDVDIMTNQFASRLLSDENDGLNSVELESGATLRSKTIILATGARWRQMNVQGEEEYKNKGVAYCPHCDGPLFKGKRVAVVGGGNSGVEAAIDLAGLVANVVLIEFDGKLRADEVLQAKLKSLPNVQVITSAQTTQVLGDGSKVIGLVYEDRLSNLAHTLDLDGIFVQIGLLPNTDWLNGVISLSPRREIEIDARGQTSMPGVFAAGDCTNVPYKQIVIATGSGATAALSAFDHLIRT